MDPAEFSITWTGAIAGLVLVLVLTIIAVVVIMLLGRSFRRFQARSGETRPPVDRPDPWAESARRAAVPDDPDEDDVTEPEDPDERS